MKPSIIYIAMIVFIAACGHKSNTNAQADQPVKTEQRQNTMKNLISIVEIPSSNFSRAKTFYESVLGKTLEEMDMGGTKMGIFPNEEGTVNVVLIKGEDYKPSADGILVYLYAGDNLQVILDKIETNGGKIVVPKTEISPEMGFFALFMDTEGNKLGLHSAH